VNRLRNRLILVFVAATLLPLAATVWITTSLFNSTLNFSTTDALDRTSRTLEHTAHEFYQAQRDQLKYRAAEGRIQPVVYRDASSWPPAVKAFADSGEPEHFAIAGNHGDRLDYFVRQGRGVAVYSAPLGAVHLDGITGEIRDDRTLVDAVRRSDVPRGFKLAYIILAATLWLAALATVIYLATRISRPIGQLTSGLGQLAAGDLTARVPAQSDDEIGRAVHAFNDMAGKLQESTERLVYLRQMASWQTLARKMAHEVKNSLTPIRLTVEEMAARSEGADRAFTNQAGQIIVDEIETLERRIRAFSQFAAEPPVMASPLDPNAALQERVAFLRPGHPEVAYECRLDPEAPPVMADSDLLKGILTNLLENAAEAAGEGGRILGVTSAGDGRVAIEVHDSGPGLSEQARSSLFQPTISFKKRGMGLGLSIARKSALLSGGDIVLVKGELGGAGFRVLLPIAKNAIEARPDRR
jgi:two-component system, NtrC family, nitrogen regulation sensor histidine kinase NtrY